MSHNMATNARKMLEASERVAAGCMAQGDSQSAAHVYSTFSRIPVYALAALYAAVKEGE